MINMIGNEQFIILDYGFKNGKRDFQLQVRNNCHEPEEMFNFDGTHLEDLIELLKTANDLYNKI
ncbi:hypothetical protein [Metabacillus arenae]|uniref:Uncharacterized protein n=1 Tax=Metabacillus arenae TaxID=2771434 RepID=A0A926RUZ1_9BACI|nr:hypothetical protein [Metabacillus arenae]MBD1379098.1 hypothetical protein [Metabacillus arenae]